MAEQVEVAVGITRSRTIREYMTAIFSINKDTCEEYILEEAEDIARETIDDWEVLYTDERGSEDYSFSIEKIGTTKPEEECSEQNILL